MKVSSKSPMPCIKVPELFLFLKLSTGLPVGSCWLQGLATCKSSPTKVGPRPDLLNPHIIMHPFQSCMSFKLCTPRLAKRLSCNYHPPVSWEMQRKIDIFGPKYCLNEYAPPATALQLCTNKLIGRVYLSSRPPRPPQKCC